MIVFLLLASIALIILLTTRLHLHPFLALFVVAVAYGLASGMSLQLILTSINQGFGETLGKIGLIIVFGVLIGTFLENSGGAYTLAEKILHIIGRKRISSAMAVIGYIVSIPVFADSGYLLIAPLAKSLSKKAMISVTGPAIALGLGLTASHVMVPPTPGPIAAAGILDADVGIVMMIGIPISALTLIPCAIFASKFAARIFVEPVSHLSEEQLTETLKSAPGITLSSIPVIIPILLIVLKSVTQPYSDLMNPGLFQAVSFLGDPVIALFIGTGLSLLLPRKLDKEMLSTTGWVGQALKDAASILLITGAGGIFGKILQNSGIAQLLGDALAGVNLSIWLPFLIAAAIKTAQGSSTVALITAASIISPLMVTLGFDTPIEKALVVLAIGAGSAVVSHANDSFFWVLSQLSGMNVPTSYRLYTTGTFVLGTTAATLIFITYLIFT
jgi:gluconate:H+ symporter, GntP family